MTQFPNDQILRELAALSMEKAAVTFAGLAREFADKVDGITGREALEAFAQAIEDTSAKMYPVNGQAS